MNISFTRFPIPIVFMLGIIFPLAVISCHSTSTSADPASETATSPSSSSDARLYHPGEIITEALFDQLKKRLPEGTHQEQVRAVMGEPETISQNSFNQEVWQWGDLDRGAINISFDENQQIFLLAGNFKEEEAVTAEKKGTSVPPAFTVDEVTAFLNDRTLVITDTGYRVVHDGRWQNFTATEYEQTIGAIPGEHSVEGRYQFKADGTVTVEYSDGTENYRWEVKTVDASNLVGRDIEEYGIHPGDICMFLTGIESSNVIRLCVHQLGDNSVTFQPQSQVNDVPIVYYLQSF